MQSALHFKKTDIRGDIMPAYDRIDRISEEIRRNVDKIIREDVRDPRIDGTWSLVRAEATRDLRYCKIRVSILESDRRAPMMDALKKASGFIRRELAARVNLRNTPELRYVLDKSMEYGVRMDRLIDEVISRDRANHVDDEYDDDTKVEKS